MEKEKVLLKNLLFNKEKVEMIANAIGEACKSKKINNFDKSSFVKSILNEFPELELKARITCITNNLKKYFEFINLDYRKSVEILLKALPPELDNSKTDDDFGDFIYAPFNEFVATYGLTEKDLDFSLDAIYEMTKRFSAEDAIRYFINKFPSETLNRLFIWSEDKNYHVRRLSSEGTRAKLPWSQKIILNYKEPIQILDKLYSDKTRYVTRSVANHLNDISKNDPEFVIQILEKWIQLNKKNKKLNEKPFQTEDELDFIVKHALRTLVKNGDKAALKLLGINPEVKIKIGKFTFTKQVEMNKNLEFSFNISALENCSIVLDYIIFFQNHLGSLKSKKVFKIKNLKLEKKKVIKIEKKHPMRSEMTTRKLFRGKHKLLLQMNGEIKKEVSFELI